ncbi:hypothetical protein Clacol_003908 [Clathrus columnatus]|uniref:F-box domain-containing protein n=1 Tax=Clathrus columnatus TaxID=1419009 RepID=A0AAV5AAD1_9AGAM|nr:hypothetical protein Clacol_003908 [Clathrus columnatus]
MSIPKVPPQPRPAHLQPQPQIQPQTQTQLQLQLQVHVPLGPVSVNVLNWNIMTPELMAMAMGELAQTPQEHGNEFPLENDAPDDAMDFVQDALAGPERVENLARATAPLFHRRLVKKSKFVSLPLEIHLQICEWLSVSDILALRRTSKDMYRVTRSGGLWLSALKRLNLLLPVLPPTSKYLYGEIKPFMAEYLTMRSVYLHENFTYRQLTGSLVRQDSYDQITDIRILPGARFIAVLTENMHGEVYLSLWELKLFKGGSRLPLVKVKMEEKQEVFEVAYGTAQNELHLFIALAGPAIQNETTLQFMTRVSIVGISLELLEELADRNQSKDSFAAIMEECIKPFTVLYETSIAEKVHQVVMCDVQHTVLPNTLMIALVCRPRLIMFDYPELRSRNNHTGFSSFLSLGIPEVVNAVLPSSIWKIKLLPWQECVLVSQIVIDVNGKDLQTVGFSLFRLPQIGQTVNKPPAIQAQYLYGLSVTGIYFSNLEEAWFSALRNPDKMLDSRFHSAPAPLSIFVTTKGPNGLVHLMMHPTAVPDEIISVRQGRGHVAKFKYQFPWEVIRRETWRNDEMSFCNILPGAFFSLLILRPPKSCALDKLGPGTSREISSILGYRSQVRQYRLASATTTGAYVRENMEYVLEESGYAHPWDHPDLVLPGDFRYNGSPRRPFCLSALSAPSIDPSVSVDFKKGVTAIAFDESTGILCYGIDQDSQLRFLDFGGEFRDEIKFTWIPENDD